MAFLSKCCADVSFFYYVNPALVVLLVNRSIKRHWVMIRTANTADEGGIAKCVSSAFDNFDEVTLIQQLAADGDKLIELVFVE